MTAAGPRLTRRRAIGGGAAAAAQLVLPACGSRARAPQRFEANASPFGARGDGRTDDTAALRKAFAAAIAAGGTLVLKGRYRVSGPLGDVRTKPSGALNIELAGDVEIAVPGDAPPMDTLLFVMTAAPCDSTISGGTLTLRLNGRCASGIVLRHLHPGTGGRVRWRSRVRVFDAHNTSANETTDNFGIYLGGRFAEVTLVQPTVVGVVRDRAAGESKALAVIGYAGPVVLDRPELALVTGPPGALDADLLALFPAEAPGGPFLRRAGVATVTGGRFADPQGRAIKLQGRARLSGNSYARTGRVPAIVESCEVDAQFDEVVERGATYRYARMPDGGSPLGRNHTLLSIQHLVRDADPASLVGNATVQTEVEVRNAVVLNLNAQSRDNSLTIDGVSLAPGPAGGAIGRAVVELDAPKLRGWTRRVRIAVSGVSGPVGAPLLGYTGAGPELASRLQFSAGRNVNAGRRRRLVDSLSGPVVDLGRVTDTAGNDGWTEPAR